jgi:hypothetical protein
MTAPDHRPNHSKISCIDGGIHTCERFWTLPESDVMGEEQVLLTFLGWRCYEALRLGAPSGRIAFMAMKFGEPGLDVFLNDNVRPAVKLAGFELRRLDAVTKGRPDR